MPRVKKKYNERIDLGFSPDGKRIRKWIRADTASEFKELKKQAQLRELPSGATLLHYAETWRDTYKANRSLQTRQMYDVAIRKLKPIGNKKIQDLTQTDFQILLNKYADSPRACEQLRLTIRQICKQAIRDRIVSVDMSDGLVIPERPKTEMRYLTDKELKQVLKCKLEKQDKLYIEVLRNTGMRPAEALALQWTDIDKQKNMIHVRRSFEFENNKPRIKTTKTNVIRDIPVNPKFVKMLLNRAKSSIFVFSVNGKPFSRSNYYTMYKRVFGAIKEQTGIDGINFYTFRHTFATQLNYNGVRTQLITTKQAAKMMGHSEHIFITKYTHIDDSKEHVQEVLEKMYKVL